MPECRPMRAKFRKFYKFIELTKECRYTHFLTANSLLKSEKQFLSYLEVRMCTSVDLCGLNFESKVKEHRYTHHKTANCQ